jgi:CO/xanthine dehydrogenase FAD-binding subunit
MSVDSHRTLAAEEFFVDLFTTAIKPGELLVEVEVPALPGRTGHAFVEFARRHGDFALAGASSLLTLDSDGCCTRARLTLLGAGQRPVRAHRSEQILEESVMSDDLLNEGAAAALDNVTPTGDIHGSSDYRKHLLRVMAKRALMIAAERARALGP